MTNPEISFELGCKRLLKLADFLEKLPRKRFDYNRWVGRNWKGKADLSCGTKACALGWATTMPHFRRLGLRMVTVSDVYNEPHLTHRPYYGPFEVAEELFGLDGRSARYLFSPDDEYDEKATPKQVAKKIRYFVKNSLGENAL